MWYECDIDFKNINKGDNGRGGKFTIAGQPGQSGQ